VTTSIPTGSTASLRKVVEFAALHLVLPGPTTRVVIDGESGPTDAVGFASGVEVASVNATLAERTAVDFGTPIDEFIFTGGVLFVGLVPAPIAPGPDPNEPVEVADAVRGVAFTPTPSQLR
jgi:hypothetical protein